MTKSPVGTFAPSIFSALVHKLDHISTACAQLGEFSLLHECELSGNLRTAPTKLGFVIREFLAEFVEDCLNGKATCFHVLPWGLAEGSLSSALFEGSEGCLDGFALFAF
jgi:hypothetical protein